MRKRPVTVLRRERDSVIVGAGLAAGDKVILSRLEIMADGMPAAGMPAAGMPSAGMPAAMEP